MSHLQKFFFFPFIFIVIEPKLRHPPHPRRLSSTSSLLTSFILLSLSPLNFHPVLSVAAVQTRVSDSKCVCHWSVYTHLGDPLLNTPQRRWSIQGRCGCNLYLSSSIFIRLLSRAAPDWSQGDTIPGSLKLSYRAALKRAHPLGAGKDLGKCCNLCL